MFRYRYNLWPDHWPDIPGVKTPGRPDLVIMNPNGPGFYVEVKAIRGASFSFSAIEDGQRRWLSAWEEVRGNGSYIGLGELTRPRGVWLVPWPVWLETEARVRELGLGFLPLRNGSHSRKILRENNIDFGLLEEYKLLGKPTTGWYMPKRMEEIWNLI